MIKWNIAERLTRAGITNANQLSKRAGISYPVAYRLMTDLGRPSQRLDVATLEAVAELLQVQPFTLLEWTP